MRVLVLLFGCLALATPAGAQAPGRETGVAPAAAIDQAAGQLQGLSAGLRGGASSDAALKSRLAALAPIEARLEGVLGALDPRLKAIDARLAQLGPPPGDGQPPEDAGSAAARRNLTQARQAVDSQVKQARLLAVEADQIGAALTDRLRRNFAARLWARNRSVADPALWRDFATALPADVLRLTATLGAEARQFATATGAGHGAGLVWFALAVALLLMGPARVALDRWGYRLASARSPAARLTRTALALWLVFTAVGTPFLAGALVRAALEACGALTPAFDVLASLLIRAVVFAALLEGLGRALLSPGRHRWRLAPIPQSLVARLTPWPAAIAAAAGLAALVAGANRALGTSLATSVAADCLTVLAEVAAVGGALAMLARARSARLAAPADPAAQIPAESRLPWILVALSAWLALAVAVIAVLTGYQALASFLMRETIWIGAILAMLFLLLRLVDDLFPALLSPRAPAGRLLQTALGISNRALEQVGVLTSGLFRLFLLLFGWAAILAPFGESADRIVGRVTSANVVFRLGQVSISPGSILGAAALFLVGLIVTRAVRGWLEVRYLPKTRLDVGLRTSVGAGVTYLGALIAALLAFAYLGLSFSQIALLASALGVGIGFGLQSIIGNFVSGLILLAERPIKVGDWIAIGELEGDVTRINLRATEIEMMDRSKLIVPNSDLTSKTVRNVTHGASAARLKIVLRIDDKADPAVARDLLLARLRAHPEVLGDPPAAVYLTDVRDGALEFTAFAYLASARRAFRVRSELLFQIVPDLKARGIALATSTPMVTIGLTDRPIEPAPTDG